ncbi:MAG: hypothetical protein AB1798_04875 [Spirochaetota bacterium]
MVDFSQVFAELRRIMLPYARKLDCKVDDESELYVDTKHIQKNKKPLCFGAVQIKKNYVSYHLMPVYVNPTLVASASIDLKKHMQGKSCFNFTALDATLFKELAVLTEAGFKDYEKQGYV